jgi:hypothetical protein
MSLTGRQPPQSSTGTVVIATSGHIVTGAMAPDPIACPLSHLLASGVSLVSQLETVFVGVMVETVNKQPDVVTVASILPHTGHW